jgi:hypothetical protein
MLKEPCDALRLEFLGERQQRRPGGIVLVGNRRREPAALFCLFAEVRRCFFHESPEGRILRPGMRSMCRTSHPTRIISPVGASGAQVARWPPPTFVVLDTLGKLPAHGHGLSGYCLACQRMFMVSLPALIKERGGDSKVAAMRPLACPGCGGRRMTFQVTAPPRGGA